jgi:ribosomal protein S18 acetylase RimI-like enzyme
VTQAIAIAPLQAGDTGPVVRLWERCGLTRPWNDPRADIAQAMRGRESTILVARCDGAVAASVMVGHDGHRGWFYYLAVDPALRGQGLGRRMVAEAETWLATRGVAKAMLLVRPENSAVQGFYAALGYQVEPRTLMTRWLDGRAAKP